jgi:hypothetical protein
VDGFEAWTAYLFARPLKEQAWEEQPDEWLDGYARQDTPVAAAERVRHLFGNAGELLRPYADDHVARGLTEIIEGGPLHALSSKQVPTVLRTTTLRSIVTLFAEVFAPRIQVEQLRRPSELEHVCFMFFDIAPVELGDDTVLDVLEAVLALDSVPCRRAALHGLGHAHLTSPEHAGPIVERWLRTHRDAPQELREYAAAARVGQVM